MHHKQRTQTTQHTTHTTEHITYATHTQYAPNPTNEVFRNKLENTVFRKRSLRPGDLAKRRCLEKAVGKPEHVFETPGLAL